MNREDSSDGPLPVRWLAELCGVPSVEIFPNLASTLLTQSDHSAIMAAHAGWWARHPDPRGQFVRSVSLSPDMSDWALAAALGDLGYDGLVYLANGEIIGHLFFQRHDTELHAFSAWSSEPHRGKNLMVTASMDFIAYASALKPVVRARIGTGHVLSESLLGPLRPIAGSLGWSLAEGGWVNFSPEKPAC